MADDLFIEMEAAQYTKTGQGACGDDVRFMTVEKENRHLVALSDGLGSGVKANVLATMTTSMAIKFLDAGGRRDHHGLPARLRGEEDRLRHVLALRLPPRRQGSDQRDGESRLHPPARHGGGRAAQGRADRLVALARPRGAQVRGRLPVRRPHHPLLGRRDAVRTRRAEGHEVRLAAFGRAQLRAREDRRRSRHLG